MEERKKRGITLIEMVVIFSIFLILIGALLTVLATSRTSWQVGSARIDLQQELRKSMDWIAKELRQGGSSTISDVPADGAWYSNITFRTPEDVIDGHIIWASDDIQYVLGDSDGRQLLRKEGSEERVLANDIFSFQIRRNPSTPAIVEVALEAQKRTLRGVQVTRGAQFKIKLRN